MSIIAPQYPCADEFPQDLRKRVNLLHAKERKLADLEAQLRILREECDDIRLEISRYLVQTDLNTGNGPLYTRKGAPLSRCPDEILTNIFSFYLIDRHISIRRLLLVCKRWNRLIMRSPRMWARIQILNIDPFIEWPSEEPLARRYITACMNRSNNLSMDIRLNLSGLNLNAREYRRELARCSTLGFGEYALEFEIDETDEIDEEVLCDYVHSALHDLTSACHCLDRNPSDNSSSGEHCGSFIHRWSTLSITLPYQTITTNYIWECISDVTSRLTTISITGYTGNWVEELEDYNTRLPDFPAVKTLILPLGRSLLDFRVSSTSLRHLSIHFYRDLTTLRELSHFERLEGLKLCGIHKVRWLEPRFAIILPSLKKLALSGHYEVLNHLDLRLPGLSNYPELYNSSTVQGTGRRYAMPE